MCFNYEGHLRLSEYMYGLVDILLLWEDICLLLRRDYLGGFVIFGEAFGLI